jgi:endonuclease YncB( thermonuclease family)
MKRVERHLFRIFRDREPFIADDVYNYLCALSDWGMSHSDMIDGTESEEYTEESLVKLLICADNKPRFSYFKIALLLIVLVAVVASVLIFQSRSNATITTVQANDLKSIVSNIVSLETKSGNNISHASLWNNIKGLESVKRHGYKTSYKLFTLAQYKAAKEFLQTRIKNIGSDSKGIIHLLTAPNIRVVDGDTFESQNIKFRLWGVDAFEMKQTCQAADKSEYKCGENSKEALQEIITQANEIKCTELKKGRYKRSIVRCIIDGVPLGELLTRSGWALDYTQYSNNAFKVFEEEAANRKAGAWAGCFVKPWDWRHKKNLGACATFSGEKL